MSLHTLYRYAEHLGRTMSLSGNAEVLPTVTLFSTELSTSFCALGLVTCQPILCLPPRILPLLWHASRFLRLVGPTGSHVWQVLENMPAHLPTTAIDAGLVAAQRTVPLHVLLVYNGCRIFRNVGGSFRFCRIGYHGAGGRIESVRPTTSLCLYKYCTRLRGIAP